MNKKETKSVADNDVIMNKLCADSVELIYFVRNIVAKQLNIIQIMTYYSLGKWIVDVQQKGKKRAKYGMYVIQRLSGECFSFLKKKKINPLSYRGRIIYN